MQNIRYILVNHVESRPGLHTGAHVCHVFALVTRTEGMHNRRDKALIMASRPLCFTFKPGIFIYVQVMTALFELVYF